MTSFSSSPADHRPATKSRLMVLGAPFLLAALSLSACSPASTDGVAAAPSSASAGTETGTSLEEIKEDGVLTVGTEGTYKPFSFHQDGTGDLTGYDVEIVTKAAEKIGLKVEFQETQWDAIFAGLDAGRFEVIANQVSASPERKEKYDFSQPYTVSPGVAIVPKETADITSLDSLKGKTSAQSLSSNWFKLAEDNGAKVEGVEGWAQAIALLEQGRIDTTLNDKLTWLDYVKSMPEAASKLKVAFETPEKSESALAVRKGSDELVKALDDALDQLRADGTLAEISKKYFGEDVSG